MLGVSFSPYLPRLAFHFPCDVTHRRLVTVVRLHSLMLANKMHLLGPRLLSLKVLNDLGLSDV